MTTPLNITPFFGSFVLETLTVGMYGESRNAVREYVQNGFDSIQKAIRFKLLSPEDGLIEIDMPADRSSLTIRDNGAGIPSNSAVQILTNIGASTKSHTSEAGFRGIGRLAGIGFTEKVTFTTKAKDEAIETIVAFNSALMRELMSPASLSASLSAEELLRRCITIDSRVADNPSDHYFSVHMQGWDDAPIECRDARALDDFLSQVAPVPYDITFRKGADILEACAASGIVKIEHVRVSLTDGAHPPKNITKPFRDVLKITDNEQGTPIEIKHESGTKWWGWVGYKSQPGVYTEDKVLGLRVRVKNIQIDGNELFRTIFRDQAKSDIRFQDWFVGEIFIKPGFLVPNARRDSFEEDTNWKLVKGELGLIAKKLITEGRRVSVADQVSPERLLELLDSKKTELATLRRGKFQARDNVQSFSVDITDIQKKIVKGMKNAGLEFKATLSAFRDEFSDLKAEVADVLTPPPQDCSSQVSAAEDALFLEILTLLEQELPPQCFGSARKILEKHYGTQDE
jgi:molecular chaperone HtpG